MHAWPPGFCGELGNYCDTSPCCTTVHDRSRYIYMQLNKAVSCALGKIGKPGMALKGTQLMAIQHVYTARTCLYGYQQIQQVHEFFPFAFVPRIHFGKAEVASRLASYVPTWCSCTLQSYILPNIPWYYLQVQVMYHDELYRECSGLLADAWIVDTRCSSPIFVECLETRLESEYTPERSTLQGYIITYLK